MFTFHFNITENVHIITKNVWFIYQKTSDDFFNNYLLHSGTYRRENEPQVTKFLGSCTEIKYKDYVYRKNWIIVAQKNNELQNHLNFDITSYLVKIIPLPDFKSLRKLHKKQTCK